MNSMNGSTGYRGATGYNSGRNMSGNSMSGQGDIIPKGYKKGQLQNFTPEMMELFQSLFSQLDPESYLSRLAGGDQSMFDEIEAPALRQFSELQGGLASRFSGGGGGQGALSSRRSSGFQNTANSAASNFAQELQSKRQGLQQQALSDLFGLSNTLLQQRPYENLLAPKQQKERSGWGGLIGAGLGGAGGFFAGGPAGALAGANLGYNVGSAF